MVKLGNDWDERLSGEFDNLMDITKVFIPTADIYDGMVIEVID